MPAHDQADPLPVAELLPRIVEASRLGGVVVTAPPGSGKTTLIPPAILDELPQPLGVAVVQPRRLAARAVAARIAELRGCRLGEEVGYRVRFDVRAGASTRLSVETTGIMLRRLLDDVAIESIGCVVLDEFHERSLEMDLLLGLLVRLRESLRPDLRVVVASATLETQPVARLLGGSLPGRPAACPVVEAVGRVHPVTIRHLRRGERTGRDPIEELVARRLPGVLRSTAGHVLVFLPGVGEIRRCQRAIERICPAESFAVLPLYGDLPPAEQDRVFADDGRRKVILATNVAETSLTVPGVTAVIDSGEARQLRVAAATGLPRLETLPISRASAEQRAGRAGRTQPGECVRLWDEASHRRREEHEVPEAVRGDPTAAVLALVAIGEFEGFPWLDPPPAEAVGRSLELLNSLAAVSSDAGRTVITPRGRLLASLPCHPRLGAILLEAAEAGVLWEASIAAALLSERDPFGGPAAGPRERQTGRSRSDLYDRVLAIEDFHAGRQTAGGDLLVHPPQARAVLRTAEQLMRLVRPSGPRAHDIETALGRVLLAGFPDRLVRLRAGSHDRGTIVGGRGVRLDRSSRLRGEPFLLALDVDDAAAEVRVRLASAVERDWLDEPAFAGLLSHEEVVRWAGGRLEARGQTRWLDLVIEETPLAVPDSAESLGLLEAAAAREPGRVLPAADSPAGRFVARVRWLAGVMPQLDLPKLDTAGLLELLPQVCRGATTLEQVRRADWLTAVRGRVGFERLAEIDRLAPDAVAMPSGRPCRLEYPGEAEPVGTSPLLAVRIQEVFGMRDTPRVADGRLAVRMQLLGPDHRPRQITDDLASFWATTYPAIRKELRRRYPKHAWPDDPFTAIATPSGLARHAGRPGHDSRGRRSER